MTQVLPRYCPRCGAPIVTSSGTCITCGLSIVAIQSGDKQGPTEQTFHNPEHMQEIDQEVTPQVQQDNQSDTIPTLQLGQPNNSATGTHIFKEQGKQNDLSSTAANKKSIGRRGLMILLAALLLLLAAIAYASAGFLGVALPGFVVIQPTVTTTAINSSVPYAGVDVTIVNVQQSQSFINDPNTSTNGMVRLNLREHNQTETKVLWSYATIARLILPDKSLVSPTYVKSVVSVAPGASQTSVVDFAVPANVSVSHLTFVLGATNEAQMLLPLMPNANLSKYQSRTIKLNGQMQYFGLNWTLTGATSSLSIQGQQAAKGMRYITVNLKVENTLSQVAITGSPYEYMRLRYGNRTALPQYATIPVAFKVGVANVTGSVSFQVPQNTRSFTLILEPQKGDSGDQASTDFQMP